MSSVFRSVAKPEMQPLGLAFSNSATDHFVFYQEATQYWIKATLGLPYYRYNGKVGAPPHGRYLYFHDALSAQAVFAILHSSLFYAYFVCYGDCFHLSDTLVSAFPIPPSAVKDKRLSQLGLQLLEELVANAETKEITTKSKDKISYAEFYGWKSKPLIDKIDGALLSLYEVGGEELDAVVNFDAKFRLSQVDGEEQETGSSATAD